MSYLVVIGRKQPDGSWVNSVVRRCRSIQEASNWGFANLPCKPTDPPWGVFDEYGKPVPPPCSGKVGMRPRQS